MLSKLQKVAEEFNVAVLMTNQARLHQYGYSFNTSFQLFTWTQVMSTPDGAMSFVPDPKKVD